MLWRFTYKFTFQCSRLLYYISTPNSSEVEAPVELVRSTITLPNGQKILKIETAEDDETRTPFVVSHGFSVTPEAMTGNIEELHRSTRQAGKPGRKVVAFDLHAGYSVWNKQLQDTQHYSKAVDGWSDALLQAMDVCGLQKAELVGHSMGAAASLVAAYKQPERFEQIHMLNPAGLMGGEATQSQFFKEVLGDLGERLKKKWENIAHGKQHQVRDWSAYLHAWKETLFYGIKSPMKTIAEATGASRLHMHELFNSMKDDPKYSHLKVNIVAGEDDALFPLEKIQNQLAAAGIPARNTVIKKWRHAGAVDDPKEVARIVNEQADATMSVGEIVDQQRNATRSSIADVLKMGEGNPDAIIANKQQLPTNPIDKYKLAA